MVTSDKKQNKTKTTFQTEKNTTSTQQMNGIVPQEYCPNDCNASLFDHCTALSRLFSIHFAFH